MKKLSVTINFGTYQYKTKHWIDFELAMVEEDGLSFISAKSL